MEVILLIETSAQSCSIALTTQDSVAVYERNNECEDVSNSAIIGGYCQEACDFAKAEGYTIVAFAITGGPGSYTGLRIEASIAKGLAFAMQKPLIALPVLPLLAQQHQNTNADVILVALSAGRSQSYIQLFDANREPLGKPINTAINADWHEQVNGLAAYDQMDIVGTSAEQFAPFVAQHPNITIYQRPMITATEMSCEAWRRYQANECLDLAYWTPEYVKPYHAVIGKNKVLNR